MNSTADPINTVLDRLDGVKQTGAGEYTARCPAHDDRSPSLSVGIGDDGRVLLNCHAGCTPESVVRAAGLEWPDLFPGDASGDWGPFDDCADEVDVYPYRDDAGNVSFEVVRFEVTDRAHPAYGEKTFIQRVPGEGWGRKKHGVEPLLYRLPDVIDAAVDGRGVFVVEGEKDVHTLEDWGFVATCNPQGAGAWKPAYTEALRGAVVYIIPDNDDEGRKHARRVARDLHDVTESVRIVELDDVPPKGDVTDWQDRGHTAEELRALVQNADEWTPQRDVAEHGPAGTNGKAPAKTTEKTESETQAQTLLRLAEPAELWQSPEGDSYATFPAKGARRTAPLRRKPFRQWLRRRFYHEQGKPPGSQALQDAIDTLDADVEFGDAVHDVHLRVAGDAAAEKRVYVDLGSRSWEAVEITPDGWQTTAKPSARFRRVKSMQALPKPDGSGDPSADLNRLRDHVRVRSDADFALLCAWLVQALNPSGPYPVLVITGEQGSGKSLTAEFIRDLVDPSGVPTASAPHKERDLIVSAENSWVLNFDNMSGVRPWLSDALCRLATGGGFRARKLYSDSEEAVFYNQRPIILNGIEDMTGRPDLADRAIVINLDTIPEEDRKSESELRRAFAEDRPAIFAGLCAAVSTALGNLDAVNLPTLPRMADFAKWAEAAEAALPVPPNTFREAYASNRQTANENALESDEVARAIRDLVEDADRKSVV